MYEPKRSLVRLPLAESIFGEKGKKTGSAWDRKLDDALGLNGGSTAPQEKKKTGNSVVDSNQRSAKNRDKAYASREDATYQMNELLKAAATENTIRDVHYTYTGIRIQIFLHKVSLGIRNTNQIA